MTDQTTEYTERLAAEIQMMAQRNVRAKVFDPFVKVWREKQLDELQAAGPSVAADAMTLALAGFLPAMSAGWEVVACLDIVKAAMDEAAAKVNAVEFGSEGYANALRDLGMYSDACRLALARSFGAVDTVRVLHSEFTETVARIQAEQRAAVAPVERPPASSPHDTEAV